MNIVLFGPPGVGKGTQAKKLSQWLRIPHISIGEILREQIKLDTDLGKQIKQINDGHLASDELVSEVVKERLSYSDIKNGFILDGYPRNLIQAEQFVEIQELLNIEIDHWICLSAPVSKLKERLVKRAKIEKRADDAEDKINTRFEVFNNETVPCIDSLKDKMKLVSSLKIDETFICLTEICN